MASWNSQGLELLLFDWEARTLFSAYKVGTVVSMFSDERDYVVSREMVS